MNTYEIQSLEHRILIDTIEIVSLMLVAMFFIGYIIGYIFF